MVIDNNVVIDVLQDRKPFNIEAERIFFAIGEEKFEPFVTANSLTDIFYVLCRRNNVKDVKNNIKKLVNIVTVVTITETDCKNALNKSMDDFEDAIIDVCAKKINADYIVSRDEKFLKEKTEVSVITPKKLLSIIKKLD